MRDVAAPNAGDPEPAAAGSTGRPVCGSASRFAVVGGGIAGLAAAHRLLERAREAGRPINVTLFEAADRLGGAIDTRRGDFAKSAKSGQHGEHRQHAEYLVEAGPDAFITNKPWAVDLCRRLGLEDRLISTEPRYRRSLVLHKGRPVPVPEGFLLLAPARVWPVLRSPLFTLRGKLRMGLEYVVPRRTGDGDADESLASFVRRRFGREALDRLVQPLVGGIYTSDPEKLSLAATMPRFLEMERRHRSLIRASRRQAAGESSGGRTESGARYGLFTAPAGGMGELVAAVEGRIRGLGGVIRTGTRVAGMRPHSGSQPGDGPATRHSWDLRVVGSATPAGETSAAFDAVILALPAWRAAELVADFDAALASELRTIEYASSAIVVSGHDLAGIAHPLDASGLVIPAIERRSILAVSFSSRKFAGRAPECRVLLRTFVGGALQPEFLQHSDDELIGLVRAELADLLGVRGREDFAFVARHERSMPQYHVGHLERVARIERERSKHPTLALAGNACYGVGIPDCIHSGERAAELVSGEWL
ncbi:MAG TPA: protoporphyrinogen oxidase [Planctomycetaceae bacterium]|nr:protoporphyrinogen oxidase [Planctomycetaceae bacterium]